MPAQTAVGVAFAVIFGFGVTLIAIVLVPVQPVTFAPVTVYIVDTTGLTTTVNPVKAPGFHVYDVAPITPRVVVFPAQIVLDEVPTVKVGFEFTVKDKVVVFAHPNALAAVIV